MNMLRTGLAAAALKAGQPLVAAIYGRVSTDHREDEKSTDDQLLDNEDVCAAEGWEVGARYKDNSKSASRFATKKRDEWDQLLEALEAGRFHVLVLWESSRGDRKLRHWVDLLDLCRELGIMIHITAHERTYDVRKRRDYKTLAEEGVDSADHSEKTSESGRRAKRRTAMKGLPNGRLLYGYERRYEVASNGVKRLVAIVPDEVVRTATGADGVVSEYTPAGIVREICGRSVQGDTLRGIAADLNRRGIPPSKTGSAWRASSVRVIAINPAYAGFRVHLGEILAGVKTLWPPLITAAVHFSIASRLNDPVRKTRHEQMVRHLLSGLAVCGVSGHRVRRAAGGLRTPVYQCSPDAPGEAAYCVSRSIEAVDAQVQMTIWARLARADIAELISEDRDTDERLAELEAAIAVKRRKIEESRASYLADRMTLESFESIETEMLADIKTLSAQVQRTRIAPVLHGFIGVTEEEIEAEWWSRSMPARREVIRLLVEKIEILPVWSRKKYTPEESVRITWRQPRSGE